MRIRTATRASEPTDQSHLSLIREEHTEGMTQQKRNPETTDRTEVTTEHLRHGPMRHIPRTAAALSVTAVAALALSACGPDDELNGEDAPEDVTVDPDDEQDQSDEQEDSQDGAEAQDAQDGASSEDEALYEAVAAVLEEYPDGVFTEFDDEGDYYEFFIYDGETEWELEVDAESFEIIDVEDDGIDDDDRQEAEAVEVEFEDALRTAAEEGDAVPTDAELDTEDGAVIYEIELANDTEVYLDVASGEVVSTGN